MQINDDDLAGPDWEAVPPPALPGYPVHALSGPLRQLVDSTPLPAALVAGAGLAVLASLSGPASMWIHGGDEVRPVLWIPLIGPKSSGKTPSLTYALRKVREYEAAAYDRYKNELKLWDRADGSEKPADPTRLLSDVTIEKLAAMLEDNPHRAQVDDELAALIKGITEYKPDGKARDKWLELWSGAPWRYSRVRADIDYYIARPVVSVCGTLQTARIDLLGNDQDGFRARWLPHAVSEEIEGWQEKLFEPHQWNKTIKQLYGNTAVRHWDLTGEALATWKRAAKRWKAEARAGVNEMVSAALHKADQQCARVALCLAESLNPGAGGELPVAAMQMAIAIVDYAMDVWRSMDSGENLALSFTENKLWPAVQAWLNFASGHDGKVSKRQLQQGKVGGARKAETFGRVIEEYEKTYPGCVETETPERGGKPHVWVTTPEYKQKKAAAEPAPRTSGVATDSSQAPGVDTGKAEKTPGKRVVRRRTPEQPSTPG